MAKNRKKDRKSNMIKPSQLFYHFCQKKKKNLPSSFSKKKFLEIHHVKLSEV